MATETHRIEVQIDSTSATRAAQNMSALTQATQRTESALGAISQATQRSTSATSAMTQAMSTSAQTGARWVNELNNASRAANNLGNELQNTARHANTASNSMNQFKSVLGAFGVATGVVGLAMLTKEIIKTNMEMEALRARLNMTLPSLAAAKDAFALILKIAKETPQSISEITKAFLLLRNSGLSTSEADLRGWTNMAAKFGTQADDLTGVIRQFGQAMSKGKLQAQDTNAMIERGIPVYALLAETMGVSRGQVLKMAEAGAIGEKAMLKFKERLFEISDGSAAMAMETLKGKVQGLASAWEEFQDKLMGNKSENMLKNMVGLITATIEHFTGLMDDSIEAQIKSIESKLANPAKSFITKGLAGAGLVESESELKTQLESLKALKQKGIDDIAKMNKLATEQKQIEELKAEQDFNKAVENGDRDALKKRMTAKLDAIKESDKAIIRQQAETASMSAKLALSIVAVESTGNNKAISPAGAVGLMQVMPENFKKAGYTQEQMLNDSSISIKMGLKVWQDSMAEAQRAVVKGAIESNQVAEYAAALYTTKHQTIHDRIKKNKGVFDISLFKEADDWWNKVTAGLELQNESVSKSFAPYNKAASEAATESKKLATQQEQAAKQQQALIDKFSDKEPLEKYLADMAELNSVRKKLDANAVIKNERLIADEFLKSTVDLQAYNQALREKEQLFNQTARGKFEKGTTELRGQKSFMSEAEYGQKQDKLTADYLTQQQGTDYKTPAEQAKKATTEMEKFNVEMDKSTAAFDSFGNSGKMAFDGILGGISAVASAATSFADDISKLDAMQKASQKEYDSAMKEAGATEEQKANASKKYAVDKMAYDSASFKAEISGARQLAGAASKMFGEKSAARKAFHAIEIGMSIIEMAMAAKKMVIDVAAGAANMFAQGGWAGFAGVAAMAAVMGGLGFAISSSSSEPQDMRGMTDSGTTGTVKGDYEKSSESISNSMKLLNETGIDQLLELKDLNLNFTALVNSVDKTVQQAVALKGSFTPSTKEMSGTYAPTTKDTSPVTMKDVALSAATSVATVAATTVLATASLAPVVATAVAGTLMTSIAIASAAQTMGLSLLILGAQYGLGKLLGIGKTKYEAIGNGIVTGIGNMTLEGMKDAVVAYDYSTVKATTKGWFSDSKKVYDVINSVDNEVSNAMNSVFDNLGKSLGSAFKYLGIEDLVQGGAVVPAMKFDLSKAKTNDEISKLITGALNTMSDKLATEIAGGLFEAFQKSGEGMLETITRITAEVANVGAAFSKLGMNLKLSGMSAITFSDTLVSMYESAPNANDALKNFISTMNAFTNAVLTPLQQLQYSAKRWDDFTSMYNEKNKENLGKFGALTRDDLLKTLETKTSDLAQASKNEAELTKNSQAVTNATNPYTAFDPAQLDAKAWAGKVPVPYENMNSQNVPADILALINAGASGQNQYKAVWQSMQTTVKSNDEKLLTGKSALAADPTAAKYFKGGIFDKASYDKEVLGLQDATKKAAAAVAEITGETDTIVTLLKFSDKSLEMNETVLKQLTTATETKTRVELKSLSELDGATDITKDLSEKTISAFKKWNITLPETEKYAALSQRALQDFTFTLEDVAKEASKLKEAGNYLTDFGKSIEAWVRGLRTTKLGDRESQLKVAQTAYDLQIQKTLSTDAETKREALSSITGYADSLITALDNAYGTAGAQSETEKIVSQVESLDKGLKVQDLQLGVLKDIREGIHKLPDSLSAIQVAIDNARAIYNANPTAENNLKLDTVAKIGLTFETLETKGAPKAFIDDLIKSVMGEGGLIASVDLIIANADYSLIQKQNIISGFTTALGSMTLPVDSLSFADTVATSAKDSLATLDGLSVTIQSALLKGDLPESEKTALNDSLKLVTGLKANIQKLSVDPTNDALRDAVNSDMALLKGLMVNVNPALSGTFKTDLDALTASTKILVNVNPNELTKSDKRILQDSLDTFTSLTANVRTILKDYNGDPLTTESALSAISSMYIDYNMNVYTVLQESETENTGTVLDAMKAFFIEPANLIVATVGIDSTVKNKDETIAALKTWGESSMTTLSTDLKAIDTTQQANYISTLNTAFETQKVFITTSLKDPDVDAATYVKTMVNTVTGDKGLMADVKLMLVSPTLTEPEKTKLTDDIKKAVGSIKVDADTGGITTALNSFKSYVVSVGTLIVDGDGNALTSAAAISELSELYKTYNVSITTSITPPTTSFADYVKGLNDANTEKFKIDADISPAKASLLLLSNENKNGALDKFKDAIFTTSVTADSKVTSGIDLAKGEVNAFINEPHVITFTVEMDAKTLKATNDLRKSLGLEPIDTTGKTAAETAKATETVSSLPGTGAADTKTEKTFSEKLADYYAGLQTFADKYGKNPLKSEIDPKDLKFIADKAGISTDDIRWISAVANKIFMHVDNDPEGKKTKSTNDAVRFADGGIAPPKSGTVVPTATYFNMGLMGEAGAEAIMPLASVGGKLGVRALAPTATTTPALIEGIVDKAFIKVSDFLTMRKDGTIAIDASMVKSSMDKIQSIILNPIYAELNDTNKNLVFDLSIAQQIVSSIDGTTGWKDVYKSNTGLINDLIDASTIVSQIRASDGYIGLDDANLLLLEDLTTAQSKVDSLTTLSNKYAELGINNDALKADIVTAQEKVDSLKLDSSYKGLVDSNGLLIADLTAAKTKITDLYLSDSYLSLDTETKGLISDFALASGYIEGFKLSDSYGNMNVETKSLINDFILSKETIKTLGLSGGYDALSVETTTLIGGLTLSETTKGMPVAITAAIESLFKSILDLVSTISVASTASSTSSTATPATSSSTSTVVSADETAKRKYYAENTAIGSMGISYADFSSMTYDKASEGMNGQIYDVKSNYGGEGGIDRLVAAHRYKVLTNPSAYNYGSVKDYDSMSYQTMDNEKRAMFNKYKSTNAQMDAGESLIAFLAANGIDYKVGHADSAGNLVLQSNGASDYYAQYTDKEKRLFANGGAFTNGVVSTPTDFNIGTMGEAGSEGVLPLTNVNGRLGVYAANDSNNDSGQTIEELKAQNRRLEAVIQVLQAGFKEMREESRKQTDTMDGLRTDTRMQKRA